MLEGLRRDGPAFLASVTSAHEAELALSAGADVIDCKDPNAGALGALEHEVVREIVSRVASRRPVSTTIGDVPADPTRIVPFAVEMASTGVEIVKIGFFGDGDALSTIAALGKYVLGARLVAVFMADRAPDFALLPHLAKHGFAGVMLDTAEKSSGRLPTILTGGELRDFVRRAHANGLFAGLAGSLMERDIADLVRLDADVLGFRGALCGAGRGSALEIGRVSHIRAALDCARASNALPETPAA